MLSSESVFLGLIRSETPLQRPRSNNTSPGETDRSRGKLVRPRAHIPWSYPDPGTLLAIFHTEPDLGEAKARRGSEAILQVILSLPPERYEDCALGLGNGCACVKRFEPGKTAEDSTGAAL